MNPIYTKIKTAFSYYFFVFIVAFILGAIRTFFLAPKLGELNATLVEVVILLSISWVISKKLITKLNFCTKEVLLIGFMAFIFLMASEIILSKVLLNQTLVDFLNSFSNPAKLVGLLAQFVFGLIPYIQQGLIRIKN